MNDTFGKQKDQFTNRHTILAVYIPYIGQYQTLTCIISFLFSNEKRICKTFHKVALGIGGLYVYWYQIILHVFPILQLQCWFSLKKKILSFFSKSLRLQFKMFQHFLLLPISIMFMTLISYHQKINQVKEQISVPLSSDQDLIMTQTLQFWMTNCCPLTCPGTLPKVESDWFSII